MLSPLNTFLCNDMSSLDYNTHRVILQVIWDGAQNGLLWQILLVLQCYFFNLLCFFSAPKTLQIC